MKYIYTLVVLIIIGVAVWFGYRYFFGGSQIDNGGYTNLPTDINGTDRPTDIPSGSMSVPATDEGFVTVRDVRLLPDTEDIGGGNYTFVKGGDDERFPDYQIIYTEFDQSYTIGLFAEPLGEQRKKAEQQFIKALGVDQKDACRLRLVVAVPADINDYFSGKDLGLSFCKSSVLLE